MKELNGGELAGFIKERQAKQVRTLRQSHKISPKLAIIRTNPDPIVDSYMRLKQNYGADIGVEVDVHTIDQSEATRLINSLNKNNDVHGVIVQIPLPDKSQTSEVLDSVTPVKDVDALGKNAIYDPATPMAISWLLAGYNVNFTDKQVVIVGHGRLVGRPLAKMWLQSGYNIHVVNKKVNNLTEEVQKADILICATGVPGLITKDMIKEKAVVVDAGVATDSNGLVGDVAEEVRNLPNITITPVKGGVGPLTVCALFENVIRATRAQMSTSNL
ncbi:MAG: bifunctional 5,10-methylenetetrahydrofolate dehydrogenase/5,10-methenyltetrahydrofolate cyclohydrolase [Candidatus Nomurabacteria bacterium]|nr:MAG: bifunctional 5,10-methylenetetrahydrofolate dehydrogenase/5,10-methenyltetrahydrofolate cyclohydrolase [Candidatus Nomurabacteria bacterium]